VANIRPPMPSKSSREAAAVYVNPTPEDALTESDRQEIRYLDASDPREFSRAVNEWVSFPDPDEVGERVFFSETLVERTFQATGRLMADIDQRLGPARGNPKKFADLQAHKTKLGEVRARARRIRATVYDLKATESTKNTARRVLADTEPVIMRAVHRRVKNGEVFDDVVAALRPAAIARHILAQVHPDLFEEVRDRVAGGEHPSAVTADIKARLQAPGKK
jgi:hypothetical protein